MDYKILLKYIKDEFPDRSADIAEVFELLRIAIDDIVEDIGTKVNEFFSEQEYGKVTFYSELAEELHNYEKDIKDLINFLCKEQLDLKNKSKEIIEVGKINDNECIEYSLYDDLTYKKPYAFKLLNNKCIKIETWQELLIKVCEIFMIQDEEKFMNFENLDHMNGRKKPYFSKKSEEIRSPKAILNKIYVETNQSANSIKNLLIKILKEYNLNIIDLKIYIRYE